MERDSSCLGGSETSYENKISDFSLVITKRAVEAAGINPDAPIVTALIGNLTGTLPTKKKDSKQINCKICNCTVTSPTIFEKHVSGAKHQKKLKNMEYFSKLSYTECDTVKMSEKNQPFPFMCKVCPMSVNSANQLLNHLSGERHRKSMNKLKLRSPEKHKVDELEVSGENLGSTAPPQRKLKKVESMYPCLVCNLSLNSRIQQDEHFHSKRHKSKEASWQQLQRVLEENVIQTVTRMSPPVVEWDERKF